MRGGIIDCPYTTLPVIQRGEAEGRTVRYSQRRNLLAVTIPHPRPSPCLYCVWEQNVRVHLLSQQLQYGAAGSVHVRGLIG